MTQLIAPCSDFKWTLADPTDQAAADVLTSVINAFILKLPPRQEKRRHKRHPFPYLVTLTPISELALSPVSDPIVVVGKHLSAGGFDFFHHAPLPHKRVIASFEDLPWGATHVILLATWCRFLRPGWYDSGGRFSHVVERVKS